MAREWILVVDDEPGVRQTLKGILQDEKYRVDVATGGEDALRKVESRLYDLILLDIWMPGLDGLEVLRRLQAGGFGGVVVIISGHATVELAVSAIKLGAFDFIEKPLSLEKTLVVVGNALRHRELEEQNRAWRERFGPRSEMIGRSIPVQALRKQIDIIAPSGGRVLIYGENGVGKELVARLIHEKSHRLRKKFVQINCAAIPDDLIESELFGYRKGAFTGATEGKKGKFEEAHEGTLFLDEVGDMSLKVQSKLLRVLEESTIEPLGSNVPVQLDVRVIAATNQDLPALIAAGRFREDLFYRLNVIPVQVMPLRQRVEDIPLLAGHFLAEFCVRLGKPVKELSSEAGSLLRGYPWPGNVRELKNIMERLAILHDGPTIEAGDLPHALTRPDGDEPPPIPASGPLPAAREAFERHFIRQAMARCGGNMVRTARELGLDRSHLYKKVKQLGIEMP